MAPDEIGQKLRESMAAHQAALYARRHSQVAEARAQLETAHRLRVEAHELDPDHTDLAWQAEGSATPTGYDTHSTLMLFYRQQLGLDE